MSFISRATSCTTAALLLASVVACSSKKNVSDDEFVLDNNNVFSEQTIDSASDLSSNVDELAELESSIAKEAGTQDLAQEEMPSQAESNYFEAPASETTQMPAQPYQGVQAPQIAQNPFEKSGFAMNAFYFVQSDKEDYASLSTLIYGRPDRADLLKDWNDSAPLKAGKVVYYNSFFRPSDREQMLSLYDDFGFQWKSYQVKKGDSLSLISKSLYGHTKNWTNIIGYNPELASPDALELGQVIRLPELRIDTAAKRQAFLASTKESGMQSQMTNQEPEHSTMTNQADQADSSELEQPVVEPEMPEDDHSQALNKQTNDYASNEPSKDVKELANIDDGLDSESNDDMKKDKLLFVGAGLIALSLLLLIIRRRRAKA